MRSAGRLYSAGSEPQSASNVVACSLFVSLPNALRAGLAKVVAASGRARQPRLRGAHSLLMPGNCAPLHYWRAMQVQVQLLEELKR